MGRASTPFPFHALGYRCNPFRVLSDEEWGEIALLSEPTRMALAGNSHVQILGRRGRGKSTALRGFVHAVRASGASVAYEYIPPGRHQFLTSLDGLEIFALDEAQRLFPSECLRLASAAKRHGTRLILGSHADFRFFLKPLVTVSLDSPNPEHFAAALQRRLDYFALPDAPCAALSPEALRWLIDCYRSDLRGAEHLLYEALPRLDGPRSLTPVDLQQALTALPAGGGGFGSLLPLLSAVRRWTARPREPHSPAAPREPR
ncbi:MAG: hypothetical protein JWQ02_1022 [Capsulimonas sp.]|nr:hypothetical protein [Capsulimonas sp.]